jgi:hypothetical protein
MDKFDIHAVVSLALTQPGLNRANSYEGCHSHSMSPF